MFAISTAWNYKSDGKIQEMLAEIKELGFQAIELGYRLKVPELRELISLLAKMKLAVSSVHNFCPVPDDYPSLRHPSNYYRLSAVDEEERKLAVKWTKAAVDTAGQVSCNVVVIHAGTIELENDPTDMIRQYKAGQSDPAQFVRLRDQLLRDRENKKKPFWESVVKSLDEVIQYAQKRKVKIGLETRYYPTEIPNFEEIGYLLDLFPAEVMGFWHDIGHGEVNVRLGLVKNHRAYLDHYRNRLIGIHIHGVNGLKDHQAPFSGDFDGTSILAALSKETIKVIESHAYATPEEIKEALVKLKALWK